MPNLLATCAANNPNQRASISASHEIKGTAGAAGNGPSPPL
ncbi:MAG: hypothetical protein ACREH8_17815 [Opitutaceae bacterium]